MNHYLIVADDFTGSNDTGVQVRRRGIPVKVVFSGAGVTGNESCVLDTESRSLTPDAAFSCVATKLKEIPAANFTNSLIDNFSFVIKKVDSTLRGNIGAETKALAQFYKPDLIIFAPAVPDLGRTTENSIHHINGIPICKTEFANDPLAPVANDDIKKIMSATFAANNVLHISLDALRSSNFNLANIDRTKVNPMRVLCFDAVTNGDLQIIVRSALDYSKEKNKRVLWVGSVALADELLDAQHKAPAALAVLASLSSVSRDQVHYAEKRGISLVKVFVPALLENQISYKNVAAKIVEEAVSLLENGKDVILLSSSTYSQAEREKNNEYAARSGIATEAFSAFTQKAIGEIAVNILRRTKVSGLFLSGGETAISCIEHLGAQGSSILTEIAVGIPLMKLSGGSFDGLKVVTKAGAFGNEDAIFYALRKLREA
jgi:uncharacterized protein YgbK (DUF1537 family)